MSTKESGTIKRKVGETRPEDGFRFVQYMKYKGVVQERWSSPEMFERMRASKRASQKRYRKHHPEKVKEMGAAYQRANVEKMRAFNRKCYRKHRLARLIHNKEWAKKHPEKMREYTSAWGRRNIGVKRASGARGRAVKHKALPSDANMGIIQSFYSQAARMTKCLGVKIEVDHIIPISKGGSHCHRNIQILPGRVNRMKASRLPHELEERQIKKLRLVSAIA